MEALYRYIQGSHHVPNTSNYLFTSQFKHIHHRNNPAHLLKGLQVHTIGQ